MNPQAAKVIVLVTGAFMFAAIGLKRDTIPDPFRFAWAAGVITLGLSVAADIAPEVAGPLAILVLMAVYARNRGVLGGALAGTAGATGPGSGTNPSSPSSGRTARQTSS